jgi:hypothetical protein
MREAAVWCAVVGAIRVTLKKVGAPEEETEVPCTARFTTEDETPRCYLPAVTATAFLAISAAVSFALFTTLILELARAP